MNISLRKSYLPTRILFFNTLVQYNGHVIYHVLPFPILLIAVYTFTFPSGIISLLFERLTFFSGTCQLVINVFSFIMSDKVFMSPLVLKEILAGYKILFVA